MGVRDYLPYNIHLLMFLEHQGYLILNNTVFQYNQSSIKTGTNGRNLCAWNPRHIAVRHFFTKDRIKKIEMVVKYCPTEVIIADLFYKSSARKSLPIFQISYHGVYYHYRNTTESELS